MCTEATVLANDIFSHIERNKIKNRQLVPLTCPSVVFFTSPIENRAETEIHRTFASLGHTFYSDLSGTIVAEGQECVR